jgi:WD40 repeat protein
VAFAFFEDSSVRLFDSYAGIRHPVPLRHDGPIVGIDFTADDRLLVTATDSTARVWDARTGAEIAILRPTLVSQLTGVTLSPDGRSALLLSRDRLIQWRCYACGDRTALLEEVAAREIPPLSAEQRREYRLDVEGGHMH